MLGFQPIIDTVRFIQSGLQINPNLVKTMYTFQGVCSRKE